MMLTTRMVQLFAVVLRKDCDRVTETLLREGLMQFMDTAEVRGEATGSFPAVRSEASLGDVSDLRQRIEGLLYAGRTRPATPSETDLNRRAPIDIDAQKKYLDLIDARRAGIRERQRAIQQEILKLEDIKRQVGLYGIGVPDAALSTRHPFLVVQTGKVPQSSLGKLEDGLKDVAALNLELGREGGAVHCFLISMKRDREQVGKILAGAAWSEIELPRELKSVKEDAFKELSAQLAELTAEQKKLEAEAEGVVKEAEGRLREVWVNLRVSELLGKIQSHFASSSRAVIFTGWLPDSNRDRLTAAIRQASEGRCYLEWHEAAGTVAEEVPVRFNNPKLLAPFEMLVSNFGVPRYGTIDPTPFVMPLYLAMFGLMFADVGQGVILALLGGLGAYLLRGNERKQGYYRLCWLIVWCGLSSVCFGLLFGSFFGAVLFKPLWFDFHNAVLGHTGEGPSRRNVFDILAVTLYFGIAVIALGLLFNWVNIIRARKWLELVFDKGGILGGWIYAGGIYIASYVIAHDYKELPDGRTLLLLVGVPSLLLLAKEPYHYLRQARHSPERKANPAFAMLNFLMKWMVELLEVFSGYLSNTLSFMRVAGLGIAHVCLMVSFFAMAEMTSGLWSVLILVVGNALVIALEGLSAGIQALRLSYYEFFTKFFHGTGTLYSPISLGSKV
ncbi:MAG: hypothetical protein JW741_22435 [Sedimentisphaerales bacterium]|nr:hypothetical protein [Sedimentisphaerales bacterium]